ncbi:MAG: class I SAM-dependent methyltransferase [Timaviella obliquedivisa GSE-PSE-MK23-08B]|jgi:predicted O-methyltransferase YrrM|nr:class I SAM-dependent methyltransferase [Timaviella obliquedivisa GSE-PSE-MK23-08B]
MAIESFRQLFPELEPKDFTNWALSLRCLEWLNELIKGNQIDSVLECGSGLSTVYLEALKQKGLISKSLSLEHSQKWLTQVRAVLSKKQLESSSLVHCPLINGWFNLDPLQPKQRGFYDLILIDSPPARTQPQARYPALEKLKDFMHQNTWIILDDFRRDDEKAIVKRWLKEYRDIRFIEEVPIGTGLAVLRKWR